MFYYEASRVKAIISYISLNDVTRNFDAPFSLTLTLSRWEREQPLATLLKFERNRAEVSPEFAKTRRTFLPLRVGGVCGADGERAGVRCSSYHFLMT